MDNPDIILVGHSFTRCLHGHILPPHLSHIHVQDISENRPHVHATAARSANLANRVCCMYTLAEGINLTSKLVEKQINHHSCKTQNSPSPYRQQHSPLGAHREQRTKAAMLEAAFARQNTCNDYVLPSRVPHQKEAKYYIGKSTQTENEIASNLQHHSSKLLQLPTPSSYLHGSFDNRLERATLPCLIVHWIFFFYIST